MQSAVRLLQGGQQSWPGLSYMYNLLILVSNNPVLMSQHIDIKCIHKTLIALIEKPLFKTA